MRSLSYLQYGFTVSTQEARLAEGFGLIPHLSSSRQNPAPRSLLKLPQMSELAAEEATIRLDTTPTPLSNNVQTESEPHKAVHLLGSSSRPLRNSSQRLA